MTTIQNYVIENLFERNQINVKNLSTAISTLPVEIIDDFLSVLIDHIVSPIDNSFIKTNVGGDYINADITNSNKLHLIQLINDNFENLVFGKARQIVIDNLKDGIFKINTGCLCWDPFSEEFRNKLIKQGKEKGIKIYFTKS